MNRAWQSLNHFTLRLQSLSVVRKNLVIFQVERGFIFLKNSLRGGGGSNNLDNKILQEKGKWGGRGKGVKVEIYCNNYLWVQGTRENLCGWGTFFCAPLKNPCFEKILIPFITYVNLVWLQWKRLSGAYFLGKQFLCFRWICEIFVFLRGSNLKMIKN